IAGLLALRVAVIARSPLALVPSPVIDVESGHALEDRVYPRPSLNAVGRASIPELVVRRCRGSKSEVMERALVLLARERRGRVGMGHEHDHLRHSFITLPGTQELVGQLRRRDDLQPEQVSVEMKRFIHVAHPEHDLRETGDCPTQAATASPIATRLMSRTRGGTEQPGASSRPRPPVSAIARLASAWTSDGGPYRRLLRWPRPPITARPLRLRPCDRVGVPRSWIDQLPTCEGMSFTRSKCSFDPQRCTELNHASCGSWPSTALSVGSTSSR